MSRTTSTPDTRPRAHIVGRLLVAASVAVAILSGAAGSGAAPRERVRLAARTSSPLSIYDEKGDLAPVATLPATTEFGTTRVVLVTKRSGRWLRVLLPERPNGSLGWVRRGDVELRVVHDRVTIDRETGILAWARDGALVLETPIAIGAPDTPTPTGRFYVTDLLDTPDGGAYGPYAIGLSAHSDTLSEFGGGDGQIGVHGTADPSSIGQAVSHGCVRVANDVIDRLATTLALGTPVTIR